MTTATGQVTADPEGAPHAAEKATANAIRDPLQGALAKIRQGIEELGEAEAEFVTDDELGEALVGLVDLQTRLAAREARLVREFERREAYVLDACVNATGWLRFRTPLSYQESKRRVRRGRVLERMPLLSASLAEGRITVNHVDAIAVRAIPQRMDAIAEHDETLTRLAQDAEPHHVSAAVKRIVELVDRDGAEEPPACAEEDLREVTVRKGFGSLSTLMGSTTALLTELLMRVRDVYGKPDDPDTPPEQRRTEGQKLHDALQSALAAALDCEPSGSTVHGVKTHAVVFVDLFTLLGEDAKATITPRLSRTGHIDPELARHLMASTNPTLRMILSMGPWMPISVGRARRTLPPWLRAASELTHQHCRAPGCDRPFAWTEADHVHDYSRGGVTATFNDSPFCEEHHDLKTKHGWTVTFDVVTGVVTWMSRDGTRRLVVPPPDP